MEGKCQAAFSCHLWAPAKATVIVGNAFSTGVESSKLCRFIGFHGKRGLLWNSLLCSFTFSSQNFCCWYHTLWNWGPFCFLFFCFYSSRSFFLRWIFFFFFFHCHCRISRGFFFPLVSAPSIFSFLQSLDSHYSQLILAMFFLLISSDLKECCLHLNSKYDFLPQSCNIIYAFLMLFVNLGRQQRRLYM